jgi:hypothetical protein
MLAKITSKNQLTLPRSVTEEVGAAEYFDVQARDGQIVLTPVRIQRADAVRAKLAELALTENDIDDAVTWARAAHTTAAGRRTSKVPGNAQSRSSAIQKVKARGKA